MTELRPYTPDDLPKVLTFLGECLRERGFQEHHPGDIVHWMSNGYRGEALASRFWLYEPDDKLLALVELAKAEWGMFTLVTHPTACSAQTERDLLGLCQRLMEERMRENPADKRTLAISVAATDQQRIDRLRALGYQPQPPQYMTTIKSLDRPLSKPSVPEGFGLRSVAAESEAGLVADVHNGSFGSSWTEAEYLKVMRTPGFKVDHELVAVAPDGRFAAFVIYWLDPISRSGLFEPVGCHEAFQRRGLATALMVEGMERMMAAGMTKALVTYKIDNLPAKRLYSSLGFVELCQKLDCEINLDLDELGE